MAVAVLELDRTDLLFQQSANGRVELRNTGRETLHNVNFPHAAAFPTLVLKDLVTDEVLRFDLSGGTEEPGPPFNLPAGETLERTFDFLDLVHPPRPGEFELTAVFTWDAESATSAAVKLKIRPSNPLPGLHAVSARGGLSPVYCLAWINAAKAGQEACELWSGRIQTTSDPNQPGPPTLSEFSLQAALPARIRPCLSVPPNGSARGQWIAWIEGSKLFYLGLGSSPTAKPESIDLDASDCRIIPPLLLQRADRKGPPPGATALVFNPRPTDANGVLSVLELGAHKPKQPVVAAPRHAWAETAYLSDLRRRTFFLVTDLQETHAELQLSAWTDQKPPAPLQVLQGWDIRVHAAGLALVCESNLVRGLVLGELRDRSEPAYALYPWTYTPTDKLITANAIPLQMPDGAKIEYAVARIDQNGAPYALLRSGDKWFWCSHDGSVQPLKAKIELPVEILFEQAERPIVMYTERDRGFQFLLPE